MSSYYDFTTCNVEDLYEGLVLSHDIYTPDYKTLLLSENTRLTRVLINGLKNRSKSSTIRIHKNTMESIKNYKKTAEDKKEVERIEFEKEIGYSNLLDKSLNVLEGYKKVEGSATIKNVDALFDEISNTVETLPPEVIINLVNTVAPTDEYLQRHLVNVGLLNGLFGEWIGLSKEKINELMLIGALHDCGKTLIPRKILEAPRKLTIVEFEVVKAHTTLCDNLLGEYSNNVKYGVRDHHEKCDGSGYPNKLIKGEINELGKITAINDIFDAITSARSYKKEQSPEEALAEIQRLKGGHLDEKMVDVFTKNMTESLCRSKK